jgi:hypothetical protein
VARANLNAAQGGGAKEIVLRVRKTEQPIDPLAHRRRPAWVARHDRQVIRIHVPLSVEESEQRVGRNIDDKAQSRFLVGEAT